MWIKIALWGLVIGLGLMWMTRRTNNKRTRKSN
jgi:predicted benzoate:H+ symporter BenE